MNMTLSKSKQEYLDGSGWSSSLFFEKAKTIFRELENDGIVLDFGRTVLHIMKNNKKIKAYVHHNSRSKEYMTLTDSKGNELNTFHYQEDVNIMIDFIKNQFN